MNELKDEWIKGWMNERVNELKDEWIKGWMNKRVKVWMKGWKYEWITRCELDIGSDPSMPPAL